MSFTKKQPKNIIDAGNLPSHFANISVINSALTSPANFMSSQRIFWGKNSKLGSQKKVSVANSKPSLASRMMSPELLVLFYLNQKLGFEGFSKYSDWENQKHFYQMNEDTRGKLEKFEVESFIAKLEIGTENKEFRRTISDLESFIFSDFSQKNFKQNIPNKIIQFYMSQVILKYFSQSTSNQPSKAFLTRLLREKIVPAPFILVDCRNQTEFKKGHFHGALNVENPEVLFQLFFEFCWKNPQQILDFVSKIGNNCLERESLRRLYYEHKRSPNKFSLGFGNLAKGKTKEKFEWRSLETQKSNLKNFGNFRKSHELKTIIDDSDFSKKLSALITETNRKNEHVKSTCPERLTQTSNTRRITKRRKNSRNCRSKAPRIKIVFYCDGTSKRSSRMLKYFETNEEVFSQHGKLEFPDLSLVSEGFSFFERKFEWFCNKPANLVDTHKTSFLREFAYLN